MLAVVCAWRLTHRRPILLRVTFERFAKHWRIARSHGLCGACAAAMRQQIKERAR